jgi:hypothetical protein
LTDKGKGYFKAVENSHGADAIAREFIGTALASWFGLSTFAFCLFEFDGKIEITLNNGSRVNAGTGFMTKEVQGTDWDKTAEMLNKVVNKDDITRQVCFDTWVRNPDRHCIHNEKPRTKSNNVFFAEAPKKQLILKAIDFTCAFSGTLDGIMDNAKSVYDESVYGLFPEFECFMKIDIALSACRKLKRMKDKIARRHVEAIPQSWNIDVDTREAWIRFIVERAEFLANNLLRLLKLDTTYLPFEEK